MSKNLENIKLTPYAKMFYVEWLIHPDSARDHMIIMDELSGNLDVERLKTSVYRYIQDHLLMHSHIENKEDDICWVQNTEIIGLEYSDQQANNEELLAYINQPFDLHKDQLCRFKLFRIDKEKYQFITVLHHLVTDALSAKEGIFKELSNYYNDKNHVQLYNIEQQKEKLADLSDFYYRILPSERSRHQAFWKQQLEDIEYIDLSFLKREDKLHQRICLDKYSCTKQILFSFDSDAVNQLNKLKRQYLITPYYFGLCVFAILLHRYTSQTKFAIAYPVAIKKGIHHIYGAQVNTTIMPYEFRSNSTFLEIYNENRKFLKLAKNESLSYTDFPNIELFNESNKRLTNIVFNQANFRFQTYSFDGVMQKSILGNFNMYLHDTLLFEQEQVGQVLYYQVRFDITQMDEVLIQNFAESFQRLFIELLRDLKNNLIDRPLHTYSLLTSEMYQHVVHGINNTQQPLLNPKTIHALFVEQAKKTPNHIAVTFENTKLSYAELNQHANQLAAYIQEEYQPKIEDLVVLHLERSHHILISILAVLKAGCAYVPVSPEIADFSLLHILTDTKTKLILINESHQIKLDKWFLRHNAELKSNPCLLVVDNQKFHLPSYPINDPTLNKQDSTSLAYVLYTSGSTGQPKGVMMEHLACVNKIFEMVKFSQITSHDVILFKTNYIFDVSFTDIFCGLLSGAQIIVTKDTFNIGEIAHQLEINSITICHFTPSQFDAIKNVKGPQLFDTLRVIHFSGEALEPKLLDDINEKVCCVNYYGPTETGEVSAELKRNASSGCVTIGYPLSNVQLYILDSNLNPVPPGVVGELHIGGLALARGYLNQTTMTQEKFIQNPFQSLDEKIKNENSRLYKTGDLVRRLLSGNIEYKSRNDYQIKIRGYRVELGEIENKLKNFPDIKQAVVLEKIRNQQISSSFIKEKYLIAYYVSDSEISIPVIRDYLMERLPDYMLPDAFCRISKLPLTSNGKLDIKQLPLIEPLKEHSVRIFPRNSLEEKICLSYAEILHLPKNEISINDDFFQLGGNSILAIKLLLKLEYLNIKIADIFKLRTPKRIAENVPLAKNNIKQKIENIIQFYLKYNYAIRDYQLEKTTKIIDEKNASYLEKIENLDINVNKKINIENVLLTGSTGHLGCNILGKLLMETSYKIYLIIRADSYEIALNRITQKFNFYFDKDINAYQDRLIILNGDLQHPNFRLRDDQFALLANNIDSVIHCASLVKHYGEYDEFYRSNVQSTMNLLEFSRAMRSNWFNYISTIGVLVSEHASGQNYYLASEDDNMDNFKIGKNFYMQTKYKSEQLVSKYRTYGINSNIFRVGNLGMHSINYKVQENIEENLFFSHLRSMLSLGMIPDEIAKMEISPVDCAAEAIVKIFDKVSLSNQTYHIFNPRVCDLIEVFREFYTLQIKQCTLNEFIHTILERVSDKNLYESYLFMLYQLWYQECDGAHSTKVRVMQGKTEAILGKLGFSWPVITPPMVREFVKHAIPSVAIEKGN